jgi:hypothetical protein
MVGMRACNGKGRRWEVELVRTSAAPFPVDGLREVLFVVG